MTFNFESNDFVVVLNSNSVNSDFSTYLNTNSSIYEIEF